METFIINSWTVDHHLAKKLSSIQNDTPVNLITSNKLWHFTKLTRKKTLELLCKQCGLEQVTVTFEDHLQLQDRIKHQLNDALLMYSFDFNNHEEQLEHTRIKCFESTMAFQIAMYHKSLDKNQQGTQVVDRAEGTDHSDRENLDQKKEEKSTVVDREQELSTYTWLDKNSEIIQHFINDESLKKQSLAYFSKLRKVENPSAVDLILEKTHNNINYAFVWMRTEYPAGPWRIWGGIDKEDFTIAKRFWLESEKVSIISALREGMEESSWLVGTDVYIASKINYAQEDIHWDTYITAQIGDYKIWIKINQTPTIYVEDPHSPDFNPADKRGPAATTAWKWIVLSGESIGSSDLWIVDWVKSDRRSKQEIKKIEWAMRHHAELYI